MLILSLPGVVGDSTLWPVFRVWLSFEPLLLCFDLVFKLKSFLSLVLFDVDFFVD